MAKCIMIQGTMSNAGKSLLCAALCRIFTQDGYKVAPFKSQNMALNSYVTNEGLEMGRAQVVQAQAAKKEPSVLMNPILLKPTTDVGSQVIVNGKAYKTMKATEYFEYKHKLIPDILKAYDTLSKENDIIVIEGAGSPAEINLKQDDIVNMGLADMVDAPVLLVGDIDRGGVFAQLYGTVELLKQDERDRIKGLVINKFRGDKKILENGVKMIEDLTGVSCVGVVPYMSVDIEDEDSLSKSLTNGEQKEIDIAVIMLPRISNFTDFDTFSRFDNVSLRYVKNCRELKDPDCIIIPGTKSTVSDLLWLRQNGLETLIKKHVSRKKPVIGICGGLQMLGRTVTDKVEGGNIKEMAGIGLLDVDTYFYEEKTLRQVSGRVSGICGEFKDFNGVEYEGYEIHMGKSGEFEGLIQSENVFATYVHGIFDKGLDEALIKVLCKHKGKKYEDNKMFDRDSYKEQQFEKLADCVRKAVDMDKIYEIMGLVRK